MFSREFLKYVRTANYPPFLRNEFSTILIETQKHGARLL